MCITEVYFSIRDRDRRDAKSDETNLASIPLENDSWVEYADEENNIKQRQRFLEFRDKKLFSLTFCVWLIWSFLCTFLVILDFFLSKPLILNTGTHWLLKQVLLPNNWFMWYRLIWFIGLDYVASNLASLSSLSTFLSRIIWLDCFKSWRPIDYNKSKYKF